MKFNTQISIIIPVFNELDNVGILFDEIVNSLTDINYEVVFVDDGSTDGTRECLKQLAKANDRIKLVLHKRNYGQSAALLSGVKAATFPIIVSMDGDGQNDPADIKNLLAQYKENTVILGHRKKRHDNFVKRFSSIIGNGVRRKILQDDCSDTGCSLKLFSKSVFLNLPYFNHMHRFLPALFKRAGLKLIMIEVNHRARKHGISKYGVMNRLFVGIYDLFGMRWLIKRNCIPEIYNEHS